MKIKLSKAVFYRYLSVTMGCIPALCIAVGQPYLPMSDDEIIEVLPKNFNRSALNLSSRSVKVTELDAAQQIRQFLALASETGDERFLGYADRLLAGFSAESIQSIRLRLAQASLLQRRHEFEPSLRILENVIEEMPRNGEAHLMAAYIKMAQGKSRAALSHCASATLVYGTLTGYTCSATAKSLLGETDTSYRQLAALVQTLKGNSTERREALLTLAEIAKMRGEFEAAEKHFDDALEVAPSDSFLLMRLADLYLAQDHYDQCIVLLNDKVQHPSLLLRLAIAENRTENGLSQARRETLQRYFEVQRLRNPQLATRDYGEYLLEIEGDTELALSVALRNWQSQREPADTELVLRAALAAKKSTEIEHVITWISDSGLQDQRISNLIASLN